MSHQKFPIISLPIFVIYLISGEDAKAIFDELFNSACPKFISPIPPDYSNVDGNVSHDAARHQLRIFLKEVDQNIQVPIIRSFLKLYTTLDVAKLASFVNRVSSSGSARDKMQQQQHPQQSSQNDSSIAAEELHMQLMVYKHKTRQMRWESGTAMLEGSFQPTSDLDFYLDKDMIHVIENKPGRRVGDWFIRHINKFEDIIGHMKQAPVSSK